MEPEVIDGWLGKRARAEIVSHFLSGLLYTIGGAAVVVLVAGGTAVVLLRVLAATAESLRSLTGAQVSVPFSSTGASWLAVLAAVLLFIGEVWAQHKELTVMNRVFLDVFFAGPRFVVEGVTGLGQAFRWWRLDVVVCTKTICLLLGRPHRVSFEELSQAVPGFNPKNTVSQLRLIDGVVALTSTPRGLSLTDELRHELLGTQAQARTGYGGERIEFRCAECGRKLRIRAFLVGLPHICPRCHTRYHSFRDAAGRVHLDREPGRKTVPPPPAPSFAGLEHHEILGVRANASVAELKRAYRKLMKQNHPDLYSQASAPERQRAEERTKAINQAYEAMLAARTESG